MRNWLFLNILQIKNATNQELLCNNTGTFTQQKVNIWIWICKEKGTRFLQKRNIFQGDETEQELFYGEMQ